MSILKIIVIALEVLLLFNLLIFVHELGHFLAARWRGLKVDRFAIWFGKPIWKKTIGGVEYALGTIPAGGYVSLPQMATMEVIEGKREGPGEVTKLPNISPLDKMIVAFAGPLFSFLLALAFALVVMIVGRPVSETEKTTTIGYVLKGGPADEAGLRPGDRILSVDGRAVTKFGGMGDSVTWRIVRSEGAIVPIKVEREGKILEFFPKPSKEPTKMWERKSLRKILISPAHDLLVGDLAPNSPACLAGLLAGDQILSVNGIKLYHCNALEDYAEEHLEETLRLSCFRQGQPLELSVKPEVPATGGKASLGILTWEDKWTLRYPGAIEQVKASVTAMVETFGALFAPHSDIKAQHLGGAVKIMEVYSRLFNAEQGWRLALWFSVLMNVNLAVLNMLPIPVLDGGHILLALVEGIRRKPISARLLGAIQTTCAVLLIGFMLYIAFYDVQDLPWKRGKDKSPDIKFSPRSVEKN
jgi:regulator of sigma E protease